MSGIPQLPPDFDPLPLLKLIPKPCDKVPCGAVFAPLLVALAFNSAAIVVIYAQAGSLLYRGNGRALPSLASLPYLSIAIIIVVLLHTGVCVAELSQTVKVFAVGFGDTAKIVVTRPEDAVIPFLGTLAQAQAQLYFGIMAYSVSSAGQNRFRDATWTPRLRQVGVVFLSLVLLLSTLAGCCAGLELKLMGTLLALSQSSNSHARGFIIAMPLHFAASFLYDTCCSIVIVARLYAGYREARISRRAGAGKILRRIGTILGTSIRAGLIQSIAQGLALVFYATGSISYRPESSLMFLVLYVLPKIYTLNFFAAVGALLDDKESERATQVPAIVRRGDFGLGFKARAQLDTFTANQPTQIDTYTLGRPITRGEDDKLDNSTIHIHSSYTPAPAEDTPRRPSVVRFSSNTLTPPRPVLTRQTADALDVVDERDEIVMPPAIATPPPRYNSAGQPYTRRYIADEYPPSLHGDEEKGVMSNWPDWIAPDAVPMPAVNTSPTFFRAADYGSPLASPAAVDDPLLIDRSATFRFGSAVAQPLYVAEPSHDGEDENIEVEGPGGISRWSSFSSAPGRPSDADMVSSSALRSRFSSSASAAMPSLRRKGSEESMQPSVRTGRTFGASDQRSRSIKELSVAVKAGSVHLD